MSQDAPATKKRLVEADDATRSEMPTASHYAHAQASAAARDRFLSTLNAYASDSDSETETMGLATASHSLFARSSSVFESMHDEPPHGHNDLDGSGVGAPRPVVTAQVGRHLLQQMFDQERPLPDAQTRARAGHKGPGVSADENGRRVVEAYVPLSTNGFLDTTDESINLAHLKVGAILCQKPTFTPTASSVATSPPSAQPSNTSPSPSVAPASQTTVAPFKRPVPTLNRFKKNSDLTEEERLYGKALTPDMADHLFEVSRVDLAQHVVEGIFLDGTRCKMRALELRSAGFVEQELYRKWKADPLSRPAQRVVVPPAAQDTAAAAPASPTSPPSPTAPSAPSAAWWVLPNLIVRVVAEAAGEKWFGKKVAVESIKRKENKVRLRVATEVEGTHVLSSELHDVLEIIGLDGVETVVPKKGGRAIIVSGPHRGEIVTVRKRIRDGATGEFKGIEVASTMPADKDTTVFSVGPHELCEMRRA